MDVLVTKRADGKLGHTVYRKPTNTHRYLQAESHHHPTVKRAVLNTLTARAHRICEPDTLEQETAFLREVFQKNGYSNLAADRALKRSVPRTAGTEPDTNTQEKRAFLPYIGGVTESISRLLRKAGVRTIYNAPHKLARYLRSEKDRLPELDSPGVYEIPCSCGRSYVGESGRSVNHRLQEHIRQCKLNQPDKSAVAEHAMKFHHEVLFDETKVLVREPRRPQRLIREAIEIARHPRRYRTPPT